MKAPRLRAKPRTIGYMRYLSKMKDLGPRRMSQDQRLKELVSRPKPRVRAKAQETRVKS